MLSILHILTEKTFIDFSPLEITTLFHITLSNIILKIV